MVNVHPGIGMADYQWLCRWNRYTLVLAWLMLMVVLMVLVHASLGVPHVKDCIDCVGTPSC